MHDPLILIDPPDKDLGEGFMVRRALPSVKRRAVGPFIFFDEMGPAVFAPGKGIDVRPHPHIGLSTVTYLFEGEILHRDSLGYVQAIRPGDVNWMTAGSGIVHSERTAPELRAAGHRLHGIQTWVALPADSEEVDPCFTHHPIGDLPVIEQAGLRMRLILGTAFGERAPVPVLSPIFYLDVEAGEGALIPLEAGHEEVGLYVVGGAVEIEGETVTPRRMAVLPDGRADRFEARAIAPSRLMLFGGAPLDAPRKLWWNFVSSRPERIEQAKADWKAQKMGQVAGETEFIPLPD